MPGPYEPVGAVWLRPRNDCQKWIRPALRAIPGPVSAVRRPIWSAGNCATCASDRRPTTWSGWGDRLCVELDVGNDEDKSRFIGAIAWLARPRWVLRWCGSRNPGGGPVDDRLLQRGRNRRASCLPWWRGRHRWSAVRGHACV